MEVYVKFKIFIFTAFIFLQPTESYSQDWKKSLKNKGKKTLKKVEKEIKKEIKPLTIDFKVSNVGYNPLKSLNTLKLTIDFTGDNPNALGLSFEKTEFDLLVNDNLVSKFYNEKKIKIPKNDSFFFQETAEISILEAGKTLFNSIRKKEAVYTIIGRYFVDTPLGTFSFDIKLLEKVVNKEIEEKK